MDKQQVANKYKLKRKKSLNSTFLYCIGDTYFPCIFISPKNIRYVWPDVSRVPLKQVAAKGLLKAL
jgi:hypothetical protein